MLLSNADASENFFSIEEGLPRSVDTLKDALDKIVVVLLDMLDVPDNDEQHDSLLVPKDCVALLSQLKELASAFSLAGSHGVEKSLEHLHIAFEKFSSGDKTISMVQRAAIIECCYILPRYFEFVAEQESVAEQPLLLAQCFYSLARTGLAPFVPENQLSDFAFNSQQIAPFSPIADSGTFRRLRQMYQIGLIGLLRQEDTDNQLNLIAHVVERILALENNASSNLMWCLLSEYIAAIRDKSLCLSAQRCHFFSRFDRYLRNFEKQQAVSYSSDQDAQTLTELSFLLVLSNRSEWLTQQLATSASFKPLFYTDKDVGTQRELMERGIDEAISAVCSAVNAQLLDIKARLNVMSESSLCEESDQRFIVKTMTEVTEVLQFCGFALITRPLQQALSKINLWVDEFPEEAELMEIANAILYIENTMLGFSTPGIGESGENASVVSVAEQSVFEHARQVLFTEMQSSIALSKRAIKDFSESNYERKHIANLSPCFQTIEGGFRLSEEHTAAGLMHSCSDFISWLFTSEIESDKQKLPIMADSLLATDYLLKELIAGRKIEASLSKLIEDNTQALSEAMS